MGTSSEGTWVQHLRVHGYISEGTWGTSLGVHRYICEVRWWYICVSAMMFQYKLCSFGLCSGSIFFFPKQPVCSHAIAFY